MSTTNQLASADYRWEPQACPICETSPISFMGRRGGAAHRGGLGVECEIWQCKSCKLVFPNPMPIPIKGLEQHYNIEANDYFQHHDIDMKGQFANTMLDKAEELVGGRGRILDVGAGRGELLKVARERGWEAVGIEPSATFAEFARQHSGAQIVSEPVEKCELAPHSFDVVILSAVLEHLYGPNETLKVLARALRPGGALFVDVPNERGLYFRMGNIYQKLRGRNWTVNLAPTFEPFHVFGFNPSALRQLLHKHGLEIAEWHVYPGRSVLPNTGGMASAFEVLASRVVTTASRIGELGTYIATWAIRS
jgi:2-polyprenyl-3-methyl-5-hydroxy-6-metoxy-1,4-benzoquinol methylase